MASKTIKASDKQAICKKLVTTLKKRYKGSAPKNNRPVLETIIFANCLENSTYDKAESAYDSLLSAFFDLNEIRVSSISEVEATLKAVGNEEWRALRIRSALQYVFEKNYEFQFEVIRKKTLELAIKNLARIPNQTNFVCYYTTQETLGSHLLPMDEAMTDAAIWLGLADVKATEKATSDAMKSAVKKPDQGTFLYLFRMLATDPKLRAVFESSRLTVPSEGHDVFAAPKRLAELIANPSKFKREATAARKKLEQEIAEKEAKKKAAERAAARAAAKKAKEEEEKARAKEQAKAERKAKREQAEKEKAEAARKPRVVKKATVSAKAKVAAKPKKAAKKKATTKKKKATKKVVKKKVVRKKATTKKKAATKKTTKKAAKKKAVAKKKTTAKKAAKKKTTKKAVKKTATRKKTTKKKTTKKKTTKRRK